MDDWEKAGRTAAEALEFGKRLVKIDASLLEVAEKIEAKIIELGAKPAFPVNLSLNHIAAHYTPLPNDETRFKEGDIVKVDIGVHINGCIGDTAATIDLGDNKELVKASEEALNEAVKIAKPGVMLCEIGKVIQETIQRFGFSPVVNLSGHGIKEYKIHSGLTVPNYDNGDKRRLEQGQIIAIEPFATNGEGRIIEGKQAGIYRLENKNPVRDSTARKILEFVEQEYNMLPFAKRWLTKRFPAANFGLKLLENQKIITQYSQLPEKSKGLVSQAEHTLRIGDKILTKI